MYDGPSGGARVGGFPLLVVGRAAGPGLRRLIVVGDAQATFACRPGERVILTLPGDEETLRRIGEVEAFDREELRLDLKVAVEGDAKAMRWIDGAKIGDRVTAELVAA